MKIKVLNIEIDSISKIQLLSLLETQSGVIVTPNIDHLVRLQNDQVFYEFYQKAEFIICDSKIVQFLTRLFPPKIIEAIPGSDLFPEFCSHVGNNKDLKHRIFLLGGSNEKISKKAAQNVNNSTKLKVIVGQYSPPLNFENDNFEIQKILDLIRDSEANVLAVGLGSPKQEMIIQSLREKLPEIKLYFAIGATIDFMSGEVKRAPVIFQKIGLEWFYRLLREPRRLFKRYILDDPIFFKHFLRQRIGRYKNPFGDSC